jgi:carboxypeptidase Ss1
VSNKIIDEARTLQDRIVAWRRDFHQHPELGFEEQRTAGIVADELERLGFKVRRNVGRTGVIGDFDVPGAPGRLLLRADMDALPVQEESGETFTSVNAGKSHLCGHDAHVAMLLGTANLLAKHRHELKASVRLMFQPSEERAPGGAVAMIREGVLDGVDKALAIHIFTEQDAGTWGLIAGPAMAAVDCITITIHGRGGHAAAPELCLDPVVAAAQIIMSLQTIMSRKIRALDAGVLSLCSIHGGDAFNVIPERVKIVGTLRSHVPAMRERVKHLSREILNGIEVGTGVKIDLVFDDSYPVTVNDATVIDEVRGTVTRLFGEKMIVELEKKFGGEDFSYVLDQVPGAMVFLGVGNVRKGITTAHHHAAFKIDEDALWEGAALCVQMALEHHAKG